MTESKQKQTLKEDLIIRGIKLLDIAYIIPIYVLGGIFGATFLDNHIYPYVKISGNKSLKEQSDIQLFMNLCIFLIINAITAYILRNILQKIPFPLDNVHGFKHNKVREVRSGQVINFVILIFSREIRNYIIEFQYRYENRIKNKNNENKTEKKEDNNITYFY